jgi:CRP-like cAMP-binding protein/Fe-S-cluster-containing hydrogenase component 2
VSAGAPDPGKITIAKEPSAVTVERMKELPIFAGVAEGTLKKLQPNVLSQVYAAGDVVLREGDYSDAAFFIASGSVEVLLSGLAALPAHPAARAGGAKGRPTRNLGQPALTGGSIVLTDMPVEALKNQRVTLEAGELFGEISALSRYPVSATVRAIGATECVLLRTPALRMLQRSSKSFKEYVDTRYRERSLGNHLRAVPLFADCGDQFIERLKSKVELVSFEPGEVIVEEGAPADAFFLVRGGYLKVAVRVGANDLSVTYLRKGDYAGHEALLMDQPWPFTLSALEHVELVKILKPEFEALLATSRAIESQLWGRTVAQLKRRGGISRDPISAEYLQMAMETGLIHGESVLLIDLETCTRCDDCVRACAETHDGTPRFIREGMKYHNWLVPTSCYACTDPVCMIGCPTGAITRPIGTTEVVIDPMTCIGCGNCSRRCPWGNIIEVPYQHPVLKKEIKLATKCDQCVGRDDGPACVQKCPHGSAVRISFKDFAGVAETLKLTRA